MYLSGLITSRNWFIQQHSHYMNGKKDELKNLYHRIPYLTQFFLSVQIRTTGIPYLAIMYKVL